MARIVSLDEYRQRKELQNTEHHPECCRPPTIDKSDIWNRDFSHFANVVYGVLKIKEILNFHLHFFEDWKHYLLCILDIVYNSVGPERQRLLTETVALTKQFLFEETTPWNKEDFALVILILELIEKSAGGERLLEK